MAYYRDLIEQTYKFGCGEQMGQALRVLAESNLVTLGDSPNRQEHVEWTPRGLVLLERVGNRLRDERESRGWSQEALGRGIRQCGRSGEFSENMNGVAVCKIESGTKIPRPWELIQLVWRLQGHDSTQPGPSEYLRYFTLGDRSVETLSPESLDTGVELLDLVKRAARKAGEMLMAEFWLGDELIEVVGDAEARNIATNADLRSFNCIRDEILSRRPGCGDRFYGEENTRWPDDLKEGEIVFVIDAIDGTIPFVSRMPLWCVAVAAGRWSGKDLAPVCSAVFHPVGDELFYALDGVGAWLSRGPREPADVPLRIRDPGEFSKATLISHLSITHPGDMAKFIDSGTLKGLALNARRIYMLGSGQLSICYCAAGRVSGFVSPVTNTWDVWGAKVILEAAARGDPRLGIVSDFDHPARPFSFGSRGVIAAATRGVHEVIAGLKRALMSA